jgi:DNA-directed RNA polymerase alpha subunit
MTDEVTRERKIETIGDMMSVNAQLMEEVANDGKMTAAEKMKSFSRGVSNQAQLSRDQLNRIKLAASLGMKSGGMIQQLEVKPD